jgi:formylglycine-generating enzyme required for sulfatase activity
MSMHTKGVTMTRGSSEQRRQTWTVRFGAAIALITLGVGWRGFFTPRPGLAAESPTAPPQAQRLPDDLVGISDAKYAALDGLAAGSQEAQERQRRAVQQLELPLEVKTRKTGILFRLIPAGSFTMGSPPGETDRAGNETPHQVTLTKAFYCGTYEVTQGQWEQVMGSNPSYFKGAGRNAPVEQVSWVHCQAFVKKLCRMEGVPEGTYRLLTEAEWEYACRGGTQTVFCYGNDLDARLANFNGNHPYGQGGKGEPRQTTVPVGSFPPNAFGLYDMHGNVWEWCQDWFGEYARGSVTDPRGPASGDAGVSRGGGWDFDARYCRSACRLRYAHAFRCLYVGLRLARTTPSYP